jgi:hypothetical protein
VAGWYLDRLTANGFLTELMEFVTIVTVWVGVAFLTIRIGEAVVEAREALTRGYDARRIGRALSDLAETRAAPWDTPSRELTLGVSALAVLTGVAWWYVYYSPAVPPAEELELVLDTIAIFAPLLLGRVLTRLALSREHRALHLVRRFNAFIGSIVLRVAAMMRPRREKRSARSLEPTEVVLLDATDALLAQLPDEHRRGLQSVPGLVRRLERHADAIRARRADLELALAGTRPADRIVDASDASNAPARLLRENADRGYQQLADAHRALGSRLADVITALESVRLGLLRLRAGVALPGDLTQDLELAAEVGKQVDALLYGEAEASRLASAAHSTTVESSRSKRPVRLPGSPVTALLLGSVALGAAYGLWGVNQSDGGTVRFEFSSFNTGFVTRGMFQGAAIVGKDSVTIMLDTVLVAVHTSNGPRSDYYVDSISVGLARETPEGWRIYAKAPAHEIPKSLAELPRFALHSMRFTVPRERDVDIRNSWIVVTFFQVLSPAVVPREAQSTGFTYAHSARDVFHILER